MGAQLQNSHRNEAPSPIDPEKEQIPTPPSTTSREHVGQTQAQTEQQNKQNTPNAPPGPPPNGGLLAWLHVLAGFMLFFNTWGLLNTFAYFQIYYESGALFQQSSSNISWIGSIQAFLVTLVGLLSGPVFDRGYLRTLLATGSFCIVFGLMMLSISKTYWQVLLAQGFCVGFGAGCLYVPCVSILPTYFSTRIGLALGLAVSGSSLGGVLYPVILYRLVDHIGFGWSVRVVAFIAFGTLLVPIAVMRLRVRPQRPRSLIDWPTFKDAPFMAFAISTLLSFIGLTTVLFYIPYYAQNRHILGSRMSFYTVAIFNASSCFGRTIPNILSDKVGPFNVLAPCTIITGVLLFCFIPVRHAAAMIVLTVLSGFFSGVLIALPPICFAALTPNKSIMGTRAGMGFAIVGFGLLIGGPGAGGVLGSKEPLNWSGLWAFGGATTCVAGVVYVLLRVYRSGLKVAVKA
ncbi:hypothetical protein H2200_011579 [Cladophialophora chaetospira]|uniref:Major facilitator superfamily (MFS) profile domain-containing protein n=1 Tax=Cladophialophora chaetospira TaxID=386627 RepID=A0AA39CDA2_9EURO|nr:hypothetical protein H2200_011579 [Cladophialophora chaetospira]